MGKENLSQAEDLTIAENTCTHEAFPMINLSGGAIANYKPRHYDIKRGIYEFFNRGGGFRISALLVDFHFFIWKVRWPGATFADYYSGAIAGSLKRGGTHKTLGDKKFLSGSLHSTAVQQDTVGHAARGIESFDVAIMHGLQPNHVCVDYGCGSLRVGQHLMNYLKPGNFWGLDIVDDFYEAGKRMLPAGLMDQKQPELHRIDSQRSRAAKLAEPDFIVSFAVLKHVPPAELRAYFKNIISMMGPRTQVIITFNQGSRTLRTGGAIWDYCSEDIIDCIQDIDHALECKFSPFSTTEKDLAPPCKSILLIERTRILGTFG